MDDQLLPAVTALLKHLKGLQDAYVKTNFPDDLDRPDRLFDTQYFAEGGKGKAYARIVMKGRGEFDRSVWGFVAMADGQNRTLGAYKKGDIFFAAGWKAPAKNVRGNAFDPETWAKFTHNSPQYLR